MVTLQGLYEALGAMTGRISQATILVGDARQRMAFVPPKSIRCCVTSPPYFGLRDYGHDEQIGLEDDPVEFVATLVDLFSMVRDALTDDGTLWLNIGDSYAGSGKGRNVDGTPNIDPNSLQATSVGTTQGIIRAVKGRKYSNIRPKNLIGIPWRLAFALQDDGWNLRNDIIWSKPNPMPESVKDRCTKSHEYLFLFTKSENYHCNMAAIAEPSIYGANESEFDTGKTGEHQQGRSQPRDKRAGAGRLTYDGKRQGGEGEGQEAFVAITETRNKRDVWTIPTKGFDGAHFAVMPEALVEPCILAGSEEGDMVLDPFSGSGSRTVGVVALRHQRDYTGIELNPAYAELSRERITADAPLLNPCVVEGALNV